MKQALAHIHPDAKIAENVKIDPFASIAANVEIGEGTWIASNVVLMDGARIGKNCKIFPGAVISAVPQDLKFSGEETTATIGDNTTVREFVTINRGTAAKGVTRIGNNCLLMAYVHVAHDVAIGNHCIIVNSVGIAGEVEIDDWAIIGGMSAIHQFTRIGAHVMISGGSLISKDVPPYAMAGKYPLSFAGINSIGLRRRKFNNETIYQIQDIYRILYQKGLNVAQAIERIEAEISESKERDIVLSFIKKSERGIIKSIEGNKAI